MGGHDVPVIFQEPVMLSDPKVSRFRGLFVGTFIRWPSLGVSIMHSLRPVDPKPVEK